MQEVARERTSTTHFALQRTHDTNNIMEGYFATTRTLIQAAMPQSC
jgi:hypothetical protein